MEALDALKQRILSLAIQGKLVPQDPKDESASVLLERIKAEKAELVKQGKIKKDKQESRIFKGDDNKYYEKIGSETKDITDEIPFEIPDSWEWVRLGNIGNWKAGSTPNRVNSAYYNGNIPWLKTGDLNDGVINNVPECITELALKETSLRLNPKGSVLIAMYGATIGKVGVLDIESTTNQACCACICYHSIWNWYLFYYLLAQRRYFVSKGFGGAQPNISREKIIATLIPLPPLSEQERIVSEIERIFKEIEAIKANQEELSKFKEGIKNKILNLAIQGKLVEQDPKDEPASVLLERIKAEKAELVKQGKIKKDKQESRIFKGADNRHYEQIGSEIKDITDEIPFDIPNSWQWCRLGSIINYGETKAVTYSECNKNLWLLDLEDIEKDTSCILKKNRIQDKPFKSTKKTFIKGDVLYSKLRPYLNKVIVADEDGICTSEILPFRIYYGIVPEYLQYCLKSKYFYEYVNRLTYGVKMPRLGTEDGKKGMIPLAPLREQYKIIKILCEVLEFINQL